MKKLNNKGFAISTVIYGLSIMGILLMAILMGTMSTTRTNSNQLAKTIEEELNRFSKTETSFSAKVDANNNPIAQEYIVPPGQSGWYRIELWGTQGGKKTNTTTSELGGGKGAYTSGVIELVEGEVLYFYVGKNFDDSTKQGRETDVRVINGKYLDKSSYETRIMVAAGGGIASGPNGGASGGTLEGYKNESNSIGGFISIKGATANYGLSPISAPGNPTNGTMAGYPSTYALGNVPKEVKSPSGTNGGGDGYFPSNAANTGGTSFISGYAGCTAIVASPEPGDNQLHVTNSPLYTYYASKYEEGDPGEDGQYKYDASTAKPYYFVDGMMFGGVNEGDGKAKIERIVEKTEPTQTLKRANPKFENVSKVRECYATPQDSNGAINSSIWNALNTNCKVAFIENGINLTSNISCPGFTAATGMLCRVYDLGSNHNLDEIAFFHTNGIVDVRDHTIETFSNGEWKIIKNKTSETKLSETESPVGFRASAYQYDSTQELPPKGNYYILPVSTENRVVTANENAVDDSKPIKILPINGSSAQKWSIEYITNPNVGNNPSNNEYKVVELKRYKALAILKDENIAKNQIAANTTFNDYARNDPQIWKIEALGNGTYTISTVVKMFDDSLNTGNIMAQTNLIDGNDNYQPYNIIIAKKNLDVQRFKLISVDYSSS